MLETCVIYSSDSDPCMIVSCSEDLKYQMKYDCCQKFEISNDMWVI
jgi:hypothetical protein